MPPVTSFARKPAKIPVSTPRPGPEQARSRVLAQVGEFLPEPAGGHALEAVDQAGISALQGGVEGQGWEVQTLANSRHVIVGGFTRVCSSCRVDSAIASRAVPAPPP
jgi:hypothetical protein